ncbi:hypothetical protein RIF29_24857 [Crotalaria pallida]|uniref:Bicarbonate transporter-like transmembrane domain-containing protein n=1 Tax=Crotalaria pallida TaxID=3830 RepID=A0AAN9I0K0_CROPI
MESLKTPLKGIVKDIRGRALHYKEYWNVALYSGFGILAPTTYSFFASALPVIAFGAQLRRDTDGSLSTIETLASTAICGTIHSILCGQPLLIVRVAEPTTIMYTYLYNFAKDRDAIFNAGNIINRFTRIAGELFGMLITVLFFQQAIKTLLCGLIGLPPSNGVLPQSPMHTKSLAVLKKQIIRRRMVKSAKESIRQKASNSEIYGNMQAVFLEMDSSIDNHSVVKELEDLKEVVLNAEDKGDKNESTFYPEKYIDTYLPVGVNEQRVNNLLQSVLVGAAIFAMPAIKKIPTSVLWGYFAYMAIDSLPGNQFFERILLLFVR